MKNIKRVLIFALALCMMAALSATAFAKESVSLSDWEGQWNSFLGYVDDKELEEPIRKMAEEKGVTVEQLKAMPVKMMETDVVAMNIKGSEVTFFDGFEARGGKEFDKAVYEFVKSHTLKFGNFEFEMHEFKSEKAKYPVLLMTDVHGEESMTHFHVRFGNNVEELIANDMWYPTYVKPTTTYEQLMAGFAHGDGGEQKQEEKMQEAPKGVKEDVALADWEGVWNNMGAYLDDEQLQSAFAKLAEKDKVTEKEAKEKYVAKRRCDFNGMVFSGDTVTLLDAFKDKGGKSVSESKYMYTETYHVQFGKHDLAWHAFKAADENAMYPVLLLMGVHGEETLTHFHLRYGKDAAELLAMDGWFPTFVKPASTYDQLMQEITD